MTRKISDVVVALRTRHSGAETFQFGDSRLLCDRLLALVREGTDRYGRAEGEPLPVVRRRDVALDWNGFPALVIETTEVKIRRDSEVDAGLAPSEGEDETLEGRQAGHRACSGRNGGRSDEMELVSERFRLIEDLAP